jgi:hypothetical protein
MMDNQRTLDAANAEDRRLRDLHARAEEAMVKDRLPTLSDSQLSAEDEDMRVNVDSPTTVHYHQPSRAGTLAKAAMAAALLGSGAGIGAAVPWIVGELADRPTPPADQDTQYEARFEIE